MVPVKVQLTCQISFLSAGCLLVLPVLGRGVGEFSAEDLGRSGIADRILLVAVAETSLPFRDSGVVRLVDVVDGGLRPQSGSPSVVGGLAQVTGDEGAMSAVSLWGLVGGGPASL